MRAFSPKIPIFLAFALAATQAFAHAQLEKSTPPVGVELKFTKVTLSGPGGGAVPLGSATTAAGNQAVLIVPIAKPLPAGEYTVHWQAVSVDTHHTQGTFEFTVKP